MRDLHSCIYVFFNELDNFWKCTTFFSPSLAMQLWVFMVFFGDNSWLSPHSKSNGQKAKSFFALFDSYIFFSVQLFSSFTAMQGDKEREIPLMSLMVSVQLYNKRAVINDQPDWTLATLMSMHYKRRNKTKIDVLTTFAKKNNFYWWILFTNLHIFCWWPHGYQTSNPYRVNIFTT